MKVRRNHIIAIAVGGVLLVSLCLYAMRWLCMNTRNELVEPFHRLESILPGQTQSTSAQSTSTQSISTQLTSTQSTSTQLTPSQPATGTDMKSTSLRGQKVNKVYENNTNITTCATGAFIRHRKKYTTGAFTITHQLIQRETAAHRKKSFKDIYRAGGWGLINTSAGEIRSGPGSVPTNTLRVQKALSSIIERIKAETGRDKVRLLNIPCGDFVWMDLFLRTRNDVIHTGFDIVPELIAKLQKQYAHNETLTFRLHDIAETPITGDYDLVFSRHMTQHLTDYDTLKALVHMTNNQNGYLLITTFSDVLNADLSYEMQYRFRLQNLELPPFSLPPPLCQDQENSGSTALWRLPLKQIQGCRVPSLNEYSLDVFGSRVYTCL